MIRVRISSHWRARRSEWLLAICTFALGITYLNVEDLFEYAYFGPMLAVMSQRAWGICAALLGMGRLTLLMINGAWRASPHGRTLGAILSCALWMMLLMSALAADRTVQSVGFWLIFFIFDAFSAVDAAGDARMADEKARAARRDAGAANACEPC